MLTANDKRATAPSLKDILEEIDQAIEADRAALENIKSNSPQDEAARKNAAEHQAAIERRIEDLRQKRLHLYYNERTNNT